MSDLVTRVSEDLNDQAVGHSFVTWSESQIRAYLVEALQVAYTARPDLFVSEHVFLLAPGSASQRPCACGQIKRVVGVCNAGGRVLYAIRKRRASDRLLWQGGGCPGDPARYRVREYSIDVDGASFTVDPPPPAGQDVYVLVECAVEPDDTYDLDSVPVDLRAAIVQWALYRAKMVDSENNATIFAVAKEHKSTFFSLLSAQGSVDSDRKSGTRSLSSLAAAESARLAQG